ncbi:hAT family C-terminal dimerization region [Phytophthora infestans]|uniref:HAT family C-terminal dimerization region n=1 Tax=Phytophthora infestans TaxID=4787 RepID=A0A8S9USL8_PHYIN|nr:hAT family C-terminal dimerization region [Phytophthora infestans]
MPRRPHCLSSEVRVTAPKGAHKQYPNVFMLDEKGLAPLRDEIGRFVILKESWSLQELEEQTRYAPISWWGTHIKMFPTLTKIAHRVFAISTSSAAAERSWSTHNCIHSKQRNRLSLETVLMLVFIYLNMGDKGPSASMTFTTPWLNNTEVEAFEDVLGVGDLVEDEAAVTEELEFDLECVVDDRHYPRAGRSDDADSDTSSTASSVRSTNELQLVR